MSEIPSGAARQLGPRSLLARIERFEATSGVHIPTALLAEQLRRQMSDEEWEGFLRSAVSGVQFDVRFRLRYWRGVVGRPLMFEGEAQPSPVEPSVPRPRRQRPSLRAGLRRLLGRFRGLPTVPFVDHGPLGEAALLVLLGALAFVALNGLAPLGPAFPVAGAIAFGAFAGVAVGHAAEYFVPVHNKIVETEARWLAASSFRNANVGAFVALYGAFLRPAMRETFASAALLEWTGLLLIGFYIVWRTWAAITADDPAQLPVEADRWTSEDDGGATEGETVEDDGGATEGGETVEDQEAVAVTWSRHRQEVMTLPDRFTQSAIDLEADYVDGRNSIRLFMRVLTAMRNDGADAGRIMEITDVLVNNRLRNARERAAALQRVHQILEQSFEARAPGREAPSMSGDDLATAAEKFVATGRRVEFITAIVLVGLQRGLAEGTVQFRLWEIWYTDANVLWSAFEFLSPAQRRQHIASKYLNWLESLPKTAVEA